VLLLGACCTARGTNGSQRASAALATELFLLSKPTKMLALGPRAISTAHQSTALTAKFKVCRIVVPPGTRWTVRRRLTNFSAARQSAFSLPGRGAAPN